MEVAIALGNIDGPIFLENYDAHIFDLKLERTCLVFDEEKQQIFLF